MTTGRNKEVLGSQILLADLTTSSKAISRDEIQQRHISLFAFSPGKLLPTYRFFASKMLASMRLSMNSGAVKPASCIQAATSSKV
jgi:hypothetical protein